MDSKETKYKIKVKTGKLPKAGCDNFVKIEIHGNQGKTDWHLLDRLFINDFEKGNKDTFKIKDIDIGDIEFIGIMVEKWVIHQEWYLEYIEIQKSFGKDGPIDEVMKFPVYCWFLPSCEAQYFLTNKTCLPQKESSTRKIDNYRTQQAMKDSIKFNEPKNRASKGFPGYIDSIAYKEMNLNLKFTNAKDKALEYNMKKTLNNAMFKSFQEKFRVISELKHYLRAAKDLNKQLVKQVSWLDDDLWRTDEEFGRQILNGYHPVAIEKCIELPSNFAVRNEHVNGLLTRNVSLDEEIELGNVYIINCKILEGIPTGTYPFGRKAQTKTNPTKLELAAAMCLLYHDSNDQLRPIAIQLGQQPGPEFPIWTPNDEEHDWLLAKMWFRSSDYQIHQIKTHLTLTHLIAEPIAIATFRCLPPAHPVHKLLREHLQFVIAINTIGREVLLARVNKYDKSFQNFSKNVYIIIYFYVHTYCYLYLNF